MGNWNGRRKRRAELSIYLPFRSVFWWIVFDWLPSDTKRAVSCEMHQDFTANARVPPKNTPGRLENASSAVSLPNACHGPPPHLSEHYYIYKASPCSPKPHFYKLLYIFFSCSSSHSSCLFFIPGHFFHCLFFHGESFCGAIRKQFTLHTLFSLFNLTCILGEPLFPGD